MKFLFSDKFTPHRSRTTPSDCGSSAAPGGSAQGPSSRLGAAGERIVF